MCKGIDSLQSTNEISFTTLMLVIINSSWRGDFKKQSRVGRMAQWVKALAARDDDLSLTPGAHGVS